MRWAPRGPAPGGTHSDQTENHWKRKFAFNRGQTRQQRLDLPPPRDRDLQATRSRSQRTVAPRQTKFKAFAAAPDTVHEGGTQRIQSVWTTSNKFR